MCIAIGMSPNNFLYWHVLLLLVKSVSQDGFFAKQNTHMPYMDDVGFTVDIDMISPVSELNGRV